jgi:hypothetical protein
MVDTHLEVVLFHGLADYSRLAILSDEASSLSRSVG